MITTNALFWTGLAVLQLAMLCGMSETVRRLVLWPVGRRPVLPAGQSWWAAYGLTEAQAQALSEPAWSMEKLDRLDRELGERIKGSWFPYTDGMRRLDIHQAAVHDLHDRTMRRLQAEQAERDEALRRLREAQARATEEAWARAHGAADPGRATGTASDASGASRGNAEDGAGRANAGDGAHTGPRGATGRPRASAANGWWTVLGVARTAPWPEIKRAYRMLRSRHSAYLRGVASPEEAAVSHPVMLKLNEAFSAAQRETGNV